MKPAQPTPIAADALETARAFFEQQGAYGFEGTAMLAGTEAVGITRCVIPDQRPYRTRLGVAVEVTDKGKLQLAAALALDERWLARIHSHPDEAFHSQTDDTNPALTANGSLSIVVPSSASASGGASRPAPFTSIAAATGAQSRPQTCRTT